MNAGLDNSEPRNDAGRDDWETHWRSYGESAHDNPAQRYRHRLVLRELGPLSSGARLVDIGSGQGDLLVDVNRAAPMADLLGVEQSAEGVRQGKSKVAAARFLELNLLDPPDVPDELAGWATHAVCSEVLEHVDDPAALLRHAATFLAPTCRLVITVPGGPMSAYDRHIGHRRHFDEKLLRNVITEAGFEVLRTRRAGFPVFNLYKLLVIARGERLVTEMSSDGQAQPSLTARLAMKVFDRLFRLATSNTPWGWQLVATASPAT